MRARVTSISGSLLRDSPLVAESSQSHRSASPEHRLLATWRFPSKPLVTIALDDEVVAQLDYAEASGSAHWSLRWLLPKEGHRAVDIAVTSLAGQVPEDSVAGDAFVVTVLDAGIMAAISQLSGEPATQVQISDVEIDT